MISKYMTSKYIIVIENKKIEEFQDFESFINACRFNRKENPETSFQGFKVEKIDGKDIIFARDIVFDYNAIGKIATIYLSSEEEF